MTLSFCCRRRRFGFVNGQDLLACSCTRGHLSWKRGGGKRDLVAAIWIFSRRFTQVLWMKGNIHRLLRAYLLCSKKKLPPTACQIRPELPSVVCRPRGVQHPGTMYICNQGPLSSAWIHCISCAPSACSRCRRCCCCPLRCDRRHMELVWTLQEVQARTTAQDLRLSCIYSQSFLLHCFFPSQELPIPFRKWFSDNNNVIGIEVLSVDPRAELA